MKLKLTTLLALSMLVLASCKDRLPTQPPVTNLPDTLANYPLNSNTLDVTGLGHDGLAAGGSGGVAFVSDRFGNAVSALHFDGTSIVAIRDGKDIDFDNSSSYSLSGWIRTTASSGQLISKNPSTGQYLGWQLGIDDGYAVGLINDISSSGLRLTSHARINDGRWHFLALAVSSKGTLGISGAATLFVDSNLEESKADGTMEPQEGNDVLATIGGNKLIGDVDEVLIYSHALNQNEIATRFHEGGWFTSTHFPDSGNVHGDLTWTNSTSGDFGAAQVGNTVSKVLHAYNDGSGPCVIQSAVLSGPNASEFSVSALSLPLTITRLDSTAIPCTWTPTSAAGARSATLTLTYQTTTGQQTLTMPLTGTGYVTTGSQGWSHGSFGTTQTILGLYMDSRDTAYACGSDGTILRSVDGGLDWNTMVASNSVTSENLYSISFNNTDLRASGVAGGNGGTIAITNDWGSTWKCSQIPGGENIRDVMYRNGRIIAVGGNGSSGFIMLSDDTGKTWSKPVAANGTLYSIGENPGFIRRSGEFVVVGVKGLSYKTSDFGSTWTNVSTSSNYDFEAISIAGDSAVAVTFSGNYGTYDFRYPQWNPGLSATGVTNELRAVKVYFDEHGNYTTWVAGANGVILYNPMNADDVWTRKDRPDFSGSWNRIARRWDGTLLFAGDNGTLYFYKP